MLVEVALLGEGQVAVQLELERTDKGSFLRVDSKVVVEIMPLSEVHGAAGVITL